jgi:hypothetical protein
MRQTILHLTIALILTLLTQLGGIAWLASRWFPKPILAFAALYTAASLAAVYIAPQFGRVSLPCTKTADTYVRSPLTCALNRHYVTPALKQVLTDLGKSMATQHPQTKTLLLDANFPFVTGFPLLPHLSHNDGTKADIAFYYQNAKSFLPGKTRSPIGYFAFEDGPSDCPPATLSLRWNLPWLQPLWPDITPEPTRMTAALNWLSNDPRVGKIFIEPHLRIRYNATHPKIRFQGCRAARHDDHIHIQL